MAKKLADYAKSMGVEVEDLKKALGKYGLDESDLVNDQKRRVLMHAMENGWARDEFKAQYDMNVRDSSDWDWKEITSQYGFSLGVLKKYQGKLEPIFKWYAKQLQKGEDPDNLRLEFFDRIDQAKIWDNTIEMEADLKRFGAQKKDFVDNRRKLTQKIREIAKKIYGEGVLDQLDEGVATEIALDLIYKHEGFVQGGFDPSIIQEALRPYANKDWEQDGEAGDIVGGEAGLAKTDLLAWLSANGIVADKARVNGFIDKMISGEITLDEVKQDFRDNEFTRQYQAYADLFARGQDVSSIAMDFRTKMATMLERSVDAISIDDQYVQEALKYKNADGKPSPMAMYEFEQKIRKTPEWDKTDQAMSAYTDIGETILRNFGFRG